ncbi:transketolase family protein [Apibacter raozihei]|nr:transketolase C-terminal domain-containing protein [Apibacter raozihei]
MKSNRQSFTQTILELAKQNKDIIIVTSDAAGTVTLNQFAEELPDQLVDVGIAEQNAIGVAAGIASVGKKVFVCGPACFYSSRSLEQIKVDVAYSNSRIKIIGVNGGVSYGPFGATHHCLHDIAAIRAFPGIHILSPSDPVQMRWMTENLINYDFPVYVRMGRNPVPVIYDQGFEKFTIGKASVLKKGTDLTLVGTGETVYHCLEASEMLGQAGFSVKVVDIHTLKPIDKEMIIQSAIETGKIITVEEHSIYGGLGAIVSEIVCQNYPVPMKILGIPDENVINAQPQDIYKYYGIDYKGIYDTALAFLKD